jgi:ATP-dependent Clp protease protease subunit
MRNEKMRQYLQLIIDNQARPRDFRAEGDGAVGKIYLYDIIDPWWGVSAADVAGALDAMGGKDVDLFINSPGGDVFEARAIYSRLKGYTGAVRAHIDGLAASAATTVAMGAHSRSMTDGAFFMIHNSWTLAFGDKNDFGKTAALLDQIDGAIAKDYVAATVLGIEEVQSMMDDETWLSAADAKTYGLVDDVKEEVEAKNTKTWNLSAYQNAPDELISPPNEQPDRGRLLRYLDMLERIA